MIKRLSSPKEEYNFSDSCDSKVPQKNQQAIPSWEPGSLFFSPFFGFVFMVCLFCNISKQIDSVVIITCNILSCFNRNQGVSFPSSVVCSFVYFFLSFFVLSLCVTRVSFFASLARTHLPFQARRTLFSMRSVT